MTLSSPPPRSQRSIAYLAAESVTRTVSRPRETPMTSVLLPHSRGRASAQAAPTPPTARARLAVSARAASTAPTIETSFPGRTRNFLAFSIWARQAASLMAPAYPRRPALAATGPCLRRYNNPAMTSLDNQPDGEPTPLPSCGPIGAAEERPSVTGDPTAAGTLRHFLANADAPCPACGYNLRGLNASRCPECSTPLELTLASARTNRYAWAFLVLAFGWVFAAGAMNGWRQLSYAIAQARVYSQTLVSYNLSINSSSGGVAFATPGGSSAAPAFRSATPPSFTVSGGNVTVFTVPPVTVPPGSPAATLAPSSGAGRAGAVPFVTTRAMPTAAPTLLGAAPPRGPVVLASSGAAYNWSSVSSSTWLNLAWWGSLCLLSAAALAALGLRRAFRRRSGSPAILTPSALRWYTRIALSLFALYAGYHVVNFTRELTGL